MTGSAGGAPGRPAMADRKRPPAAKAADTGSDAARPKTPRPRPTKPAAGGSKPIDPATAAGDAAGRSARPGLGFSGSDEGPADRARPAAARDRRPAGRPIPEGPGREPGRMASWPGAPGRNGPGSARPGPSRPGGAHPASRPATGGRPRASGQRSGPPYRTDRPAPEPRAPHGGGFPPGGPDARPRFDGARPPRGRPPFERPAAPPAPIGEGPRDRDPGRTGRLERGAAASARRPIVDPPSGSINGPNRRTKAGPARPPSAARSRSTGARGRPTGARRRPTGGPDPGCRGVEPFPGIARRRRTVAGHPIVAGRPTGDGCRTGPPSRAGARRRPSPTT